ncbi:hypothetical protein D4R89_06210 [bacterium]|nr:MAG: hypothetical protein D4R89_06210 [bacterium]
MKTDRRWIVLGLLLGFIIIAAAGCANKKNLITIDEQKTQLDQAKSRIGELEKNKANLEKNIQDVRAALDAAQKENKTNTDTAGSLKTQLAALETQKVELEKAIAAAKDLDEKNKKRMSNLNNQIYVLKKDTTAKDDLIAAKESEIASLQATQTSLKKSVADQERQMGALNDDKKVLSDTMDQTVTKKNRTTWILAILLVVSIASMIFFIAKSRKQV